MARNRMIKADYWADEKIGKLSLLARLLFIGSWTFADDGGTCRANEVYLRNNIFPYDENITISDIKNAVSELSCSGVVVLLEHKNERYLKINNFLKHQTINKPSSFRYISVSDDSVVVVSEQSCPKEKVKEKEKEKENVNKDTKNIFKNIHPESTEIKTIEKYYKEKFKKNNHLISARQKQEICRIHNENQLTVDHWKKIIFNASGGWSVKDGNSWKKVMPCFQNIITNWERFYNNEYNLDKPKKDECDIKENKVQEVKEDEKPVRYEMPAEYSSANVRKMIAEKQRKAVQA